MKQHRNVKPVDTYMEVTLSLDYSITPIVPEVPGYLEVPPGYKTTPIGAEELPVNKNPSDSKVIYSRMVEIEDPRFEETYTAYVTRTSTGWNGRIPDVPEIDKCEGVTQKALLESLKDNLCEVLKARSDAWDKQIDEDIKAGKLDHLREEILEDIQAGRLTDL